MTRPIVDVVTWKVSFVCLKMDWHQSWILHFISDYYITCVLTVHAEWYLKSRAALPMISQSRHQVTAGNPLSQLRPQRWGSYPWRVRQTPLKQRAPRDDPDFSVHSEMSFLWFSFVLIFYPKLRKRLSLCSPSDTGCKVEFRFGWRSLEG